MQVTWRAVLTLFSLALGSVVLVASASPALGADSQVEGQSPTVSFVDQEPLALDRGAVEKLVEKGALEIKVHNDLGVGQPVTLELAGLGEESDSGLAALFVRDHDTKPADPGATATLTLHLVPSPSLEAGAYTGTLLAYGGSGGLARRALTVTYPSAPVRTETAGENSLNPERPIDITLRAVNYLPSLLSNLLALGIFLTIALIATAVLFKDRLNAFGERLPGLLRMQSGRPVKLLVALGVLSGVLTLYGLIEDGLWDAPGFHAISSRPIDLAPAVPDGTRGTVSSEGGSIAQLIAAKGKLRPENLSGAEKFVGKYNLGGDTEKTGAVATVAIRDYWIYAVIVITLGLIVGFALHRWLQELRPKAKLHARLERLRHDYEADLEGTQDSYRDSPYKDIRMDGLLRDRENEINALLDGGDTSAASAKVDALGTYLDRFATLREKRRNLENAVDELGRADLARLDFDLADAGGYQAARRTLEQGEGSNGPDSDETEIKAEITRVDELTRLMEGTGDQVKSSDRWLQEVDLLREHCVDDQLVELGLAQKSLKEAGQSALQANSTAELDEARKTGNAAVRSLTTLIRQVRGPAAPTAIREAVIGQVIRAVESVDLTAIAEDLDISAVRPDVSGVEARISWKVLAADDSEAATIHVDDIVQFTIELDAAAQPTFPQVEIDFGEGPPIRRHLPPVGKPLIVRRRYRTSLPRSVVVRAAPGGNELCRVDLPEVDPHVRMLPSQVALAATDRVVARAAFILAVGSGMVALYFTDPAWGEPVDYLAAFLWGGATGEGVKLAAGIADRVWPTA